MCQNNKVISPDVWQQIKERFFSEFKEQVALVCKPNISLYCKIGEACLVDGRIRHWKRIFQLITRLSWPSNPDPVANK